MVKLIKILYAFLPKSVIQYFGNNNSLKGIRDKFLRPNKEELIVEELISWGKGNFYFLAPIRMAVKARNKGIENKLLKNSLKLLKDSNIEKAVILDVGANYGFISLALQSNLNDKTVIYSFEPHPKIFNVLKKSVIKNNFSNIKIENVAVGNEERDVALNLYGQSSNILESNSHVVEKIKINQIRLDDYLSENNIIPNFIKIDVDGYELNVLKGLKETILKYRPLMVIETNDDNEMINFLKDCNYKLFDLDLNEFEQISNNVFCIYKD